MEDKKKYGIFLYVELSSAHLSFGVTTLIHNQRTPTVKKLFIHIPILNTMYIAYIKKGKAGGIR